MGIKGSTNRQRIIDAADNLFYQRGYNQTSFSDISDITGIPRGNFYYYFKTKQDILGAVVDSRQAQIRHTLDECESQSDDAQQRLIYFIEMLLRNKDMVVQSGCPVGTLCSELAKDDLEDLHVKSVVVFDVFREWLAGQFFKLGYQDNADEKSLDLLARMQGITVIANVYHDKKFLHRAVEELKAQMSNLLKS